MKDEYFAWEYVLQIVKGWGIVPRDLKRIGEKIRYFSETHINNGLAKTRGFNPHSPIERVAINMHLDSPEVKMRLLELHEEWIKKNLT